MPRQQSSINSNNWRQPQGPLTSEINKVGQTLKSLSVNQPRRNRGNTFTSKMPTIDEDDSFTTVKPKRMREAPVEIYEKAYAIQSPAALYGAGTTGASSAENRTFSRRASAQGSLKHVSLAIGIDEDVQKPRRYPKDLFQVGTIVRCPLHENMGTSRESEVTAASKFASQSHYGAVFSKMRVMIIIARFQSHYVAVPLYTHNGVGLLRKTADERKEYVSIKDHRIEGQFTAQSNHGYLTTGYIKPGIHVLDPKSTAHVTYCLARRYDLPVVHHGNLSAQATNRLLELYKLFSPK